MTGWIKRLAFILILLAPMTTHAADPGTSPEVLIDFSTENRTRPTQDLSDVFRSTVAFTPTNVTAKINPKSVVVTADISTAVRVVVIQCGGRTYSFRNVAYKAPVLVTSKLQIARGASSSDLTFTQAGKVLYHKAAYHPRDRQAYIEMTQGRVDAVRRKISFRKDFRIPARYRHIRLTYIYTSAIDGKNVRSQTVTVKAR